jgi:two-component system, OmpR family, osmolarity sensor histidine kinase EnvZ
MISPLAGEGQGGGWSRLMRLWPQSLLWRTFLLLALLSVASTAAWFFIFRAYEQQPRARQIAQNLVSVVNLTRAALVTSQADRRRELLEELAEREGIQVYPAEARERMAPAPESPAMRLVYREVRDQLGQDTRFAYQRDGLPGFWVSFRIDSDQYWVRVPRDRIVRSGALRWLGWGILALALSLLAAYFIVSHITRPLKALARAASEIGRGRPAAPVSESGASEIRTVSSAFNQMAKDLARLDEDRTLILAGVSHDLRTPLARLRLGVEMSAADESLRDGMTADIEEMDRIIGQFLDFARIGENGGGEPLEELDIDALAQELTDHYHKIGHAIESHLDAKTSLRARPKALRRALANLVDNALRYGGDPVTLFTCAKDNTVTIEVMDRGPGIPEPEAERMKLPFTRMDAARGGKSGSGLGLAIVNRIVQAHGGRLDLLKRSGGGLVARILLPL